MEFTELLTVPGTAAAGILVTQFAKAAVGLPAAWAKRFAVLVTTALFIGAIAVQGGLDAAAWFAAILTGMTAGMAALSLYDTGLDTLAAVKR